MYLSQRSAFVRNVAVATVNGTITLVILLIAPLGLAGVIANTFLVTVSTFIVSCLADFVVAWLSFSPPPNRPLIRQSAWLVPWPKSSEIERKRRDNS